MRTTRILLLVLLVLCGVFSDAQGLYSRKEVGNDELHLGMVKWSERRLRWDDFRASNTRMDKNSSHIALYAKPKTKRKVVDGINYKYVDWESYMVQNKSWSNETHKQRHIKTLSNSV